MRPIPAIGVRLLLLLILLPGPASAGLPPTIFSDGGYLVSKENRLITSRNPHRPLVPASTWKIATALMALERLGPEFRFVTDFHLADGHLFIKGFGDPMLVSEEVALIAEALAGAGIKAITDIVLDDSFFQLEQPLPAGSAASLRSYDAANGALVVNFNTINIEVATDGSVRSGEPQTPTLPVMRDWARKLPPGEHRVNLSRQPEHSLRYGGELFQHFLTERGIQVTGGPRRGTTPRQATDVYRHLSSRTLAETVEAMLMYSNNFIANQLFLTAAAAELGAPATWAKGRRHMHEYLGDLGLNRESFRVEEGSGLSRDNRISPEALRQVLDHFRPYAQLLPHWQGRLVKSGTLNGVYAYAGYFGTGGELDPFVLILQQRANTRDRALDILEKQWQQNQAPVDQH